MRPTPIALILLATLLASCSKNPATPAPTTPATLAQDIRTLIAKEELIPVLNNTLAQLDTPIDIFPDSESHSTRHPSTGIQTHTWQNPASTGPFHPSRYEITAFTVTDGTFASPDTFIAQVQLEARLQQTDSTIAFTADLTTTFTRSPDATWAPTHWQTLSASEHSTQHPLFAPLPIDAPSQHQKILLEHYFTQTGNLPDHFTPDALNTHPAIAVVDIDADGYDDLYITTRHGPNLLYINRYDGTFRESAAAHGLDIPGSSTSATFADFDNDGDPDLVLGRPHSPSLLLVNQDGHFVPADLQPDFPALVTSTTTADVNRDGLLDIFFTTYSPLDLTSRTIDPSAPPAWATDHLDPDTAAEVARRNATSPHPYLAQVGPPDRLFLNTGHNTFAPASPELTGYTNAFQAAFHDIDRDGDPDLYIASDFAPDRLYRNDTPKPGAPPTFTDITPPNLPFGFGMGAAFADIDNDTAPELYTSNMFSKAGRRITAALPGLDPRLRQAADGNRFFRTTPGGTLTLDPKITEKTANAQWSWGGAFADFDNDTFLDLYVPAGYYTAPPEHAVPVDL